MYKERSLEAQQGIVYENLTLRAEYLNTLRNVCQDFETNKRGGRTRFEITEIPSILSQITVVPSTIFMKLRIFVSVT